MKIKEVTIKCDRCSKTIASGDTTRGVLREAREHGATAKGRAHFCKPCSKKS